MKRTSNVAEFRNGKQFEGESRDPTASGKELPERTPEPNAHTDTEDGERFRNGYLIFKRQVLADVPR